jgi:SAM-dependent methyltransferase
MTYWPTSHGIAQTDKPLRGRDPLDRYPTPPELCRAALALLTGVPERPYILDVGCGTGAWGQAVRAQWPAAWVEGIDIDPDRLVLAVLSGNYNLLRNQDFAVWTPNGALDLVIGNPPYRWAEPFVVRALDLLQTGGQLLFLLRLAFLESQGRYQRLYRNGLKPVKVWSLVERPSFTGDGKTDATAYALFLWQKGWRGGCELDWLSWR